MTCKLTVRKPTLRETLYRISMADVEDTAFGDEWLTRTDMIQIAERALLDNPPEPIRPIDWNQVEGNRYIRTPAAWYRGVSHTMPGEPTEYDVDMQWGDDPPDDSDAWAPLFKCQQEEPDRHALMVMLVKRATWWDKWKALWDDFHWLHAARRELAQYQQAKPITFPTPTADWGKVTGSTWPKPEDGMPSFARDTVGVEDAEARLENVKARFDDIKDTLHQAADIVSKLVVNSAFAVDPRVTATLVDQEGKTILGPTPGLLVQPDGTAFDYDPVTADVTIPAWAKARAPLGTVPLHGTDGRVIGAIDMSAGQAWIDPDAPEATLLTETRNVSVGFQPPSCVYVSLDPNPDAKLHVSGWPQRMVAQLGRPPQLGDWYAECCVQDLEEVWNATRLAEIFSLQADGDTGGSWWANEADARAQVHRHP
jgi:hypothetical protein